MLNVKIQSNGKLKIFLDGHPMVGFLYDAITDHSYRNINKFLQELLRQQINDSFVQMIMEHNIINIKKIYYY